MWEPVPIDTFEWVDSNGTHVKPEPAASTTPVCSECKGELFLDEDEMRYICTQCGLSEASTTFLDDRATYKQMEEERGGKSEFEEKLLEEGTVKQVTQGVMDDAHIHQVSPLARKVAHAHSRIKAVEEVVSFIVGALYVVNDDGQSVPMVPPSVAPTLLSEARRCIEAVQCNATKVTLLYAVLSGLIYFNLIDTSDEAFEGVCALADLSYYSGMVISAIKDEYKKWDDRWIKETSLKGPTPVLAKVVDPTVKLVKKKQSIQQLKESNKKRKLNNVLNKALQKEARKKQKSILVAQPLQVAVATPSPAQSAVVEEVTPTEEFKAREEEFRQRSFQFTSRQQDFFFRHYIDPQFHEFEARKEATNSYVQFANYPEQFFKSSYLRSIVLISQLTKIPIKTIQSQFQSHARRFEEQQEDYDNIPCTRSDLGSMEYLLDTVKEEVTNLRLAADFDEILNFVLHTVRMGILYNDVMIASCVVRHVSIQMNLSVDPNSLVSKVLCTARPDESNVEYNNRFTNKLSEFNKEMLKFSERLQQKPHVDIEEVWRSVVAETKLIRQGMSFVDEVCDHGKACACYGIQAGHEQLTRLFHIDCKRIDAQFATIKSTAYIYRYLSTNMTLYLESHGLSKPFRRFAPQVVSYIILYCALKNRVAASHIKENGQEVFLKPLCKTDVAPSNLASSFNEVLKDIASICKSEGNNKGIILTKVAPTVLVKP